MGNASNKLSALGQLLRTVAKIPGLEFLNDFAGQASKAGSDISNAENRVNSAKGQVKHAQNQVDKLKK